MNDPYGLGPPRQPPHPHHGPHYGQPGYGQPGYGQPGYGQQPPPGPQGYVSYGQGAAPANVYVPTAMPANHELSSLDSDGQLWLLVAAAGFWFGFGWITGPLAWYFGSQVRGKYRALGHHPSTSANWAYGLGIATTLIYLFAIFAIISLVLFAVGATVNAM